mgnify:CR=1 FL=1
MEKKTLNQKRSPTPQQMASDPNFSAWVNASAGSGKTKVLTDRLLQLLLQGVDPSQILCLTFTKAAAAEMTERLYKKLSTWAQSDEETRHRFLSDLLGREPSKNELLKAANCLYDVRDNIPGIGLQTFHSYCQKLLQKFPLEANLKPGFLLMDETQEKKEVEFIKKQLVYERTSLTSTLEILSEFISEKSFEDLLNAIISNKNYFTNLFSTYETLSDCQKDHVSFILGKELADEQTKSSKTLQENLYKEINTPINTFLESIKTLIANSATEEAFFKNLKNIKNNKDCNKWLEIKKYFLTKENTIKTRLLSKKTITSHPCIYKNFIELTTLLEKLLEKEKSLVTSLTTNCVLELAYGFLTIYNKIKTEKNILDFDDIILKVRDLFKNTIYGPLILHRESQEISHILMDEAQDTSPIQWEVIYTLSQELLSSDIKKTFFAVGDAKQSIYSFQGADYDLFKKMHNTFKQLHTNIERPWLDISLDLSYRSTPTILKTVDNIFNNLPNDYTLQTPLKHKSFRNHHKGEIHIEALTVRPSKDEIKESFLETPLEHAQKNLATTLAEHIATWYKKKPILPSTGAPLQPCDIMVLLRKRSQLGEYLTHALKERNIPVNGEDRIKLWQHLAIQDLFYMGQWLIEPYDDFALVAILKSPLFRLPEEDIFFLCHNRKEQSLWDFLKKNTNKYSKIVTFLENLSQKSKYLNPYNLYTFLLEKKQLKKAYISIFGNSVEVYIALFLEQLFKKEYTPSGLGSLKNFLDTLESNKDESYPYPQENKNCIQIMTVHGAKGRQAPVVVLPDTTDIPNIRELFLWHEINNHSFFVFSPARLLFPKNLQHILHKADKKQLNEYIRLLYVALTRAEDHLFLAGIEPHKDSTFNWYNLSSPHIEKENKNFFSTLYESIETIKISKKTTIKNNAHYPILEPPSEEEAPLPFKAITSSSSNTKKLTPLEKLQSSESFFQKRGTLIHKLLESSPFSDFKNLEKHVSQTTSLSAFSNSFSPVEKDKIVQEIWNLQKNEQISKILSFDNYSEHTLVGFHNNTPYRGRIDRLAFDSLSNILYIIDFKTSLTAPSSFENIPPEHKLQLYTYTQLLKETFSQISLQPTLIYTKNRRIFYL